LADIRNEPSTSETFTLVDPKNQNKTLAIEFNAVLRP
jgi:hypothetical protein